MNIPHLLFATLLLVLAGGAQAQSDWAPCAEENAMCRVQGEALVRFGVPGRYAFKVVNGRVMCDTDEFGDPAPQQAKRCEASRNWRGDERYRGWRDPGRGGASGGWRVCANEGDVCRFNGAARVRYGANGRYTFRDATDGVACNNRVFGDPAPEVAKQCDVQVEEGGGPPQAERTALKWDACAAENARCNVGRDTIVRFGNSGRWLYREVARSVDCSNRAFGGDPLPNQTKRCEALRIGR